MIKEIKDLLLDGSYRYVEDVEQQLPLDENGNVLTEYLSYVSLNNMHNLIKNVTRNVSHVIIENPEEGKDFANAYIESSFYVVAEDTMETILKLLVRMEKEENNEEVDDLNLSV